MRKPTHTRPATPAHDRRDGPEQLPLLDLPADELDSFAEPVAPLAESAPNPSAWNHAAAAKARPKGRRPWWWKARRTAAGEEPKP